MFEKSSIMVLLDNNEKVEIFKLETSRKAQMEICSKYAEGFVRMSQEKERIEFDGNYKPEIDETLFIENYKIEQDIVEAVKKPSSISCSIL